MTHELLLLLLLAILITICKFAGHLSQRYLKQPVVFGEILAGLVLGPTLCNIFGWSVFRDAAPWLHDHITTLANLGVLLLMFVAGLETDLEQMRKVGKAAFWTALCGVIVPLVAGAAVSRCFGIVLREAIFIGAVLTATSVSISAQTLMEIGQLTSRPGMTILGAAVIDDVMGIVVLSFVVAFGTPQVAAASSHTTSNKLADLLTMHLGHALGMAQTAPLQIGVVLLLMVAFFCLAVLVGSQVNALLLRVQHLHASHIIPATALVLLFLFAVGAEYIGQVAAITGTYLLGICLSRTPFHKEIEQSVHPFTYALFVPIFFMSIGLGANARELGHDLWFSLAIILVAIVTKIIGCGLGARCTGFSNRESCQIGIGMISRGEVGLIVAQVGLVAGVITPRIYAVMVMMVLASTVITPLLLRWAFPHTQEVDSDIYESVAQIEDDDDDHPVAQRLQS